MYYLENDLSEKRRTYRVVTIVMFLVAVLTLCMRLFVRLFADLPDLAIDAVFSVTVQIGLFVLLPFLAYKFILKKNVKEIAEFTSMKKIKWYYLVLAALLGFCVFIATIGISAIWQAIIASTGYVHSSSATEYPEQFNVWMFIAEMALTALLPGFCEEFLIRGGILTTMRGSYKYMTVLYIMAVVFGLFHQNITQVFYTACFGMLMAFLTIKLGSIFPAMIIHFVNNGMSVYIGYADEYNWTLGGGFYDGLQEGLMTNPAGVLGIYVFIVLIGAGIVLAMLKLRKLELQKQKDERYKADLEAARNSAADPYYTSQGGSASAMPQRGDFVFGTDAYPYGANRSTVPQNAMSVENIVPLFKPTVRDNAFLWGAFAVTVLSTLCTYIWGLL